MPVLVHARVRVGGLRTRELHLQRRDAAVQFPLRRDVRLEFLRVFCEAAKDKQTRRGSTVSAVRLLLLLLGAGSSRGTTGVRGRECMYVPPNNKKKRKEKQGAKESGRLDVISKEGLWW